MRVLYTHDAFSLQRYGGISRYVVELVRHMPADVQTRVFSGLHINDLLEAVPSCGVRVPAVRYTHRARFAVNDLAQSIACLRNGCDVVHKTYYGAFKGASGAARVVTVYDMIHELYPESFSCSDQSAAKKRESCLQADHILAISHSTKSDLVRILGIPAQKITVTHLASSLDFAVGAAVLPNGRPYVLHVGQRDGYKAFKQVLAAFATAARVLANFDLVSFGPDWSMDECREIERLALRDRVHRVGGSDRLLAAYYKGARLLVYPSRYEGFGLPPLEAMTIGCPVLCARVSSIPEVVGEAGLYFDHATPDALRDTLEAVAFDETRLTEARRLGLQRSMLFSWQRCASETAAVYAALA